MKKLLLIFFISLFSSGAFPQTVGIGTTSPHDKAVLDISSTDKGVLFPRMTTAQRNAISNPPDGLHIYNTTERGLNYYDSVYAIWNSYLDEFKTVIFHISNSAASLNFYDSFASKKPANRYLVIIDAGVTLAGLNPSDTGLIFSTMPNNTVITLRNHGFIGGAGGAGGNGRLNSSSPVQCGFGFSGSYGGPGGHAIATKPGVVITVTNYGFIAGGGGGGGSGGPGIPPDGYGGGGGGGAGTGPGNGGTAGRFRYYGGSPIPSCQSIIYSSPGIAGTITAGGNGGAGSVSPNPPGGNGGNGGARGMPGQAGSDGVYQGGAAGKAIGGGSGNSLVNVVGGQSIGAVD